MLTDRVPTSRAAAEPTEASVRLYRYAVSHGRADVTTAAQELAMEPGEITRAREELVRLRLVAQTGPADVLIPVHPDRARVMVNAPLINEIKARERVIERNDHRFQRMSEAFAEATLSAPGAVDVKVLTEPAKVRLEVDSWIMRCTDELVTMHPGGARWDEHLADAAATDRSLLRRGVTRRTVYHHTARASLSLRSYVGRVAEHGGLVRTTSDSFERMHIFDGQVAIIPVDPRPPATGAAVITHPEIVAFLYRSFERVWSSAMPFMERDSQYEEVSGDTKVSLLRLMASGLKDEAIANRLGMATRTCRRHMASIMDELNVSSRFQAGVMIAQMGVLAAPTPGTARADAFPWW